MRGDVCKSKNRYQYSRERENGRGRDELDGSYSKRRRTPWSSPEMKATLPSLMRKLALEVQTGR